MIHWKERGEFHLGRKEFELAVEAITKALQEAEQQGTPELIGEGLKILDEPFWRKSNGSWRRRFAMALMRFSQKSSDEKLQQVTLGFMAEVEGHFLEKVWKVRR